MQSYNVADAKSHFSEILQRVSEGEEILLTRRGRPVARIIPEVQATASILGAGISDPNINHEVVARDEWWQSMPDSEAGPWYE